MHTEIQEVGLGGTETNGYSANFDNIAGYLATNLPLKFRWPFAKRPWMKLNIYGGVRLEYSNRRVLSTKGEEFMFEYAPNSSGQQVISRYCSSQSSAFLVALHFCQPALQ